MIYLASPYSDNIEDNYAILQEVMWQHFQTNPTVIWYSPILHWHHTAERFSGPTNWEAYDHHNHHMLKISTQLLVLAIDGWVESKGVRKEIEWAKEMRIPYNFVDEYGRLTTPDDLPEDALLWL